MILGDSAAVKALLFSRQKINLHQAGQEFEFKAPRPMPGSAGLSFIAITEMDNIVLRITQAGIAIEQSRVELNWCVRTGSVDLCT